jgi:glycosyltransferase involved in cell wall biosynthesis
MIITPCFMVKNEEIWIERILRPFANLFPQIIVADTGSTDGTLAQIAKIPNAHVMKYARLSPAELGKCRQWMQEEAKQLFGATHIWLIDGDELYPTKYIRYILDNMMADNALSGYTYGVECTEKENGECWLFGVGVNRQAIFSVDAKWHGDHPFESPDCYVPGHPLNHYFQSPGWLYHFFHIHQMKRSHKDADVFLRNQKRYQFSMQNHPEIVPVSLWLKNESEYQDEQ